MAVPDDVREAYDGRVNSYWIDGKERQQKWVRLGTTLSDAHTTARWELNREDWIEAIDALLRLVEQRTT